MQEETETRRCPLWVKIVLALSLALNLCIAGLVAGFVLRGGPMAGRAPAMGYAMPYVLALPRDLRRDVFGAVRNDDSLPDRRARREEYRDMIKALKVTPFDATAVEAVLLRQGDGVSRVQAAAQAAWLEAVSGLSDEERAAYTDRMQEALNRNGRPKKGKN
ncbi:MAG: periplasmic heavy metal sensor [Tateyamaria sp.]|uniref:periplasmic heavy metal sensor n=1 Tax=Tateyamaria sp. TaxID=1929288 RepID=UPI0032815C24